MSGEPDTGEAPATGEKPKINRFRKRFDGVRLSPEAAARQGKAATAAWMKLGKEASIEFLNAHSNALGGRPIDLAVESAEGLAAVEKLLADRG